MRRIIRQSSIGLGEEAPNPPEKPMAYGVSRGRKSSSRGERDARIWRTGGRERGRGVRSAIAGRRQGARGRSSRSRQNPATWRIAPLSIYRGRSGRRRSDGWALCALGAPVGGHTGRPILAFLTTGNWRGYAPPHARPYNTLDNGG